MTGPQTPGHLPLTAAVLAGGRSVRMGVDKTLLTLEGQPLVARVCDAVQAVASETIVVTNRPEAFGDVVFPAGVGVIRDEVAYQGPLGGLVTALRRARNPWVLAVAADMPHLDAAVVRSLWELTPDADVVVPVSENGHEPLLALYRVDACLAPAVDALDSGRRRLVALFPHVRVKEVPVDALRAGDPDLKSFRNVNTPLEFAEARDAVETGRMRELKVVEVAERRARLLPAERPVTVFLNDDEIATMQATPRELEPLAVGFLLAEGFLSADNPIVTVESDAKRGLAWVRTENPISPDLLDRRRVITSGCGKGLTFSAPGNVGDFAAVDPGAAVSAQSLYDYVRLLSDAAVAYKESGGMHAAGIGIAGHLVLASEDVGRHNAVDKVLGKAWLDGIGLHDAALVVTGRISYEMALKAVRAGIPVVASRSAVTDMAADLADRQGVALAGYVRGGKLTVYSHPERIVREEGAR